MIDEQNEKFLDNLFEEERVTQTERSQDFNYTIGAKAYLLAGLIQAIDAKVPRLADWEVIKDYAAQITKSRT